MSRKWVTALAAAAFVFVSSYSPAKAQISGDWGSGSGQGYVEYGTSNGQNRLTISCDVAASADHSGTRIYLEIGTKPLPSNSAVGFGFDDEPYVRVWLQTNANGDITLSECPRCGEKFKELWAGLRAGNRLEIEISDGRRAEFSLRGTARLLPETPCPTGPEPGETVAGASDRTLPAADDPWAVASREETGPSISITINGPQRCSVMGSNAGSSPSSGGNRAALVVGMADYSNGIPSLRNPVRDVRQVSESLLRLGFSVYLVTDTDDGAVADCARRLAEENPDRGVTLFYYAGHGIQIRDENYLIATNASLEDQDQAGFIPVDSIAGTLQGPNGAFLVFLDACRDNPFVESGQAGLSPSTGRGLAIKPNEEPGGAQADVQARGVFVSYSTSPNSVALDGEGDISPYAKAFAEHLLVPGQSIQKSMAAVANAVGEATDWTQTPWTRSSLTDELNLAGPMTMEEAQAASENWARRSRELLEANNRQEAMITALKGIPAHADSETARRDFALAYRALENAFLSATQPSPESLASVPGRLRSGSWTSPDRNSFAIAYASPSGEQLSFELFDMRDGDKATTLFDRFPSNNYLTSVVYSRDGNALFAGYDNGLTLWNARDGSVRYRVPGVNIHGNWLALSPDKRKLFAQPTYNNKTFMIIDLENGNTVSLGVDRLNSFGADFQKFVAGLEHPDRVSIKANFIDGNRLCFALAGDISKRNSIPMAIGTYDLSTGRTDYSGEMEAFNAHWTNQISCSLDGRYAAVAAAEEQAEPVMHVWDFQTRDKVLEASGYAAAFDPGSRYAAITRSDGIAVFEIASGATIRAQMGDASAVAYILGENRPPYVLWNLLPVGSNLLEQVDKVLTENEKAEVARERIDVWRVAASNNPAQ